MNVTSAIPIISAAAVAAVRPGFRREFSRPIRLIRRDGSTPGNSIGHSGCHFVTALRTHIGTTISSSSGLIKAPRRNAPTRPSASPGPNAPYRSSQYGSVKNGQSRISTTTVSQWPIGLTPTASGRTSRDESIATPTKSASTPTPSRAKRSPVAMSSASVP